MIDDMKGEQSRNFKLKTVLLLGIKIGVRNKLSSVAG